MALCTYDQEADASTSCSHPSPTRRSSGCSTEQPPASELPLTPVKLRASHFSVAAPTVDGDDDSAWERLEWGHIGAKSGGETRGIKGKRREAK
jgi:hypothetical protein